LCNGRFRYRLRHRGKWVKCPYCLIAVRVPVAPLSDAVNQPFPDGQVTWQSECQNAVACLVKLLCAAKRKATPCSVIELVRQLPRSNEDLEELCSADTLLVRCLDDILDDRELIGEAKEFGRFLKRIAAMPPARMELLEASVVGALTGAGLSE